VLIVFICWQRAVGTALWEEGAVVKYGGTAVGVDVVDRQTAGIVHRDTVMRRITTFRSTTDRLYDGGLIRS
jgi:hypothetical protein